MRFISLYLLIVYLTGRLRTSLADEQLHKFAYVETLDTELLIQADLEERGSVYVAGCNSKGQLGLGDTEARKTFVAIAPLRGVNVTTVCAGTDMCYAITDEHVLYVWGGGGVGRTGLHALNSSLSQNRPKKKTGTKELSNWLEPAVVHAMAGEECTSIAVGSSHVLAIGRGGDCFIWGDGMVHEGYSILQIMYGCIYI